MTSYCSIVLHLFSEKQKVSVPPVPTTVPGEVLAILVNVTVSMAIKDQTVQLVYVLCSALHTATTVGGFVTAKKGGRVQSVTYPWLSVNFLPAPITVVA